MKHLQIINSKYFAEHREISKQLKRIPKPPKGCWYDVEYEEDGLWLFEKTYALNGREITTDHFIVITNEGKILDTKGRVL